jgi:hypothetical protein
MVGPLPAGPLPVVPVPVEESVKIVASGFR